jgi:hypothetical protein
MIIAAEPFIQQFLGKSLEELQTWIERDGGKVERVA